MNLLTLSRRHVAGAFAVPAKSAIANLKREDEPLKGIGRISGELTVRLNERLRAQPLDTKTGHLSAPRIAARLIRSEHSRFTSAQPHDRSAEAAAEQEQ